MKKTRYMIIVVAVIVFACMIAFLVWQRSDPQNTLDVGYYTEVDQLDLYKTSLRSVLNIGYLIWDPLLERDPYKGKILPHLVSEWQVIDPTTWEFKLVPDVKFHNGNPLTAESIEYTVMERILGAEDSPRKSHFAWIKDIRVIDTLTFQVLTYNPYPLLLERFNTLFPYDPIEDRNKSDDYIRQNPMGTGPYKVKRFDGSSQLELQANPDYWKKGIPKSKISRSGLFRILRKG